MKVRNRVLVLCLLSLVLGCGRESGSGEGAAAPAAVTVTNVVTVTREVVVTNEVLRTVAVTNVVVERREPERILSARKTAPYVVASASLDEAEFRKLLSDFGARVMTCDRGTVALVEASDKAVQSVRMFATLVPLAAADKLAADVGEDVRIVPVSSIDLEPVAKAVRELGGRIVQVISLGRPAVRAKMSVPSIRKLAERGDVRRIERDEVK